MHASTALADYPARRAGLAVTVLLHVALLAALLHAWPAQRPLLPKAPMVMTYIVAPIAENPKEPPRPLPVAPAPKPRPAPTRPLDPPPILAVASDAPAAITVPASDSTRPPSPDALAAAPAVAPSPSPSPAAAITPPSFNAAYLDNPAPAYPALARRTGEQGRVTLRVLVSAAGTAESVEVRTSSGSPRLDHAALETVRRWRFVPARQGGSAVAAWVLVPISFTLAS